MRLTVDCLEIVINGNLATQNLLFSKEIKNENQAYTIIDDYLNSFDDFKKIDEKDKFNEIKFQYYVKLKTGFWSCIGFNFNNYEI